MIYGSRKAAIWFAVLAVSLWAFIVFIPLHDAPDGVRFVLFPVVVLYLYLTPPGGSK